MIMGVGTDVCSAQDHGQGRGCRYSIPIRDLRVRQLECSSHYQYLKKVQ